MHHRTGMDASNIPMHLISFKSGAAELTKLIPAVRACMCVCMHVRVCMCVYVCTCMYVCSWESERERESVCVCDCSRGGREEGGACTRGRSKHQFTT